MSKPENITHFTAWRPLIWATAVSLVLWILAWMFWPTATLWIWVGAGGVLTSLAIGAEIQDRILARQAFLQDLEEERRETIQADLNATGELDAAASEAFSIPADLNATGKLYVYDESGDMKIDLREDLDRD